MITMPALVAIAVSVVLLMGVVIVLRKRRTPKELNVEYFSLRWKELQKMCRNKNTWPLAVIDADTLLDEALKQSKVKGKTMGERLVSVQRDLSNNDAVWYAHKLRNKLVHENLTSLKKDDVKNALIGFRQALKDLGALE